VSNIHAVMDNCNRVVAASERTPLGAIESLRVSATGLAIRLLAGLQHRSTMQRIGRFPDHRLKDIGFERDWDGSVIPTPR
jgi:hypothetical protein